MRHSSVHPCTPPPPLPECNNLGKAFQQFSPWKTQQTKAVAFVALPSDFDSPSRRTKNHMRLWAKEAYREGERCCHSSQVSIIINSPSSTALPVICMCVRVGHMYELMREEQQVPGKSAQSARSA